jgi:3-methylcrotonyl-CoA carboxylase alpha subunit
MAKNIKKLLIANRGEISRRIQRTCREMGILSIALATTDELDLPHAKEADFVVNLGQGPLSETYLNSEKLIKIALEMGADAIHPGYGFLSEKAPFAQAVERAGLIFVGPSSSVIELMGDKQQSKIKMSEIGVPLIPGYHGDQQDLKTLTEQAKKIGLPLLIKASAGGGGKGMRIVRSLDQLESELDGAKREAMNAFGDDKVLLERYLENPRHIEIQVFSDPLHARHLHLFERECSIQRRYQKIIEEAPAPGMTEDLRQRMCETAIKITKALDYRGAGTLEFMLDQSGGFFFLEMNTRLQVEHPVTEMITGVDLVRLQLMVAMEKDIQLTQEEIFIRGHAIEVRVYAEDPDQDFLPCTGRITATGKPLIQHFRVDAGYEVGDEITTQFDPMIAKLIVWGSHRDQAISRMKIGLQSYGPLGLQTNVSYLLRILHLKPFADGLLSTDFIKKFSAELQSAESSDEQQARAIAISLFQLRSRPASTIVADCDGGVFQQLSGFRLEGRVS